jgi:hypothetical protein
VVLASSPLALLFAFGDLVSTVGPLMVLLGGAAAIGARFDDYGIDLMRLDPSARAEVVRHVRHGTAAADGVPKAALVRCAERVVARLTERQKRGSRISRALTPVMFLGFAALVAITDRNVGGTMIFLVPGLGLAVFLRWLGQHERQGLANAMKARSFIVGDAPLPPVRVTTREGPSVRWRWVLRWFLVVVVGVAVTLAAIDLLARGVGALV